MTSTTRAILAGVLLLGAAATARAQSTYGPGGMFVHPNALMRAPGVWNVGASWFRQEGGERRTEWAPFTVTGGITERLEAGVMLVRERTAAPATHSAGLFAKVRIQDFDASRPAIAVAASHIGGPVALTSVSVAGTWKIPGAPENTLAHAGVQWARRADGGRTRDDVAPYVGVQLPVTRDISAVAEYGTRFGFDRAARSGFGAVWSAPAGHQVALGWVNIGRSQENQFFVGVGYPLGGGKIGGKK